MASGWPQLAYEGRHLASRDVTLFQADLSGGLVLSGTEKRHLTSGVMDGLWGPPGL